MEGVSLITLTMNHYEATRRALDTLLMTEFPCPAELIVVDNGSSDGTQEELVRFGRCHSSERLRVKLVMNDENRGCAGGRNIGARLARHPWLVFFDNDIEIRDRDWLRVALGVLKCDRSIGVLGVKLIYGDRPSRLQSAGMHIDENGDVKYIGDGGDPCAPQHSISREVQAVAGACLMIGRQLFHEVGGFDEIYDPANYEDLDLCYKVRRCGLKVMYCAAVSILHWAHTTSSRTPLRRVNVKNQKTFRERWAAVLKDEARGILPITCSSSQPSR